MMSLSRASTVGVDYRDNLAKGLIMFEIILAIILAVLGSQAIATIISTLLTRRKRTADKQLTEAQTARVLAEDARSETVYWKERVDTLVEELSKLQVEVTELKRAIDEIKTSYERRINSLHDKIAHLAQELERANRALETANATIVELRDKIEAGNKVISELREEISTLLIKAAGKEKK
jgi:chromosome segregation ATPase